MKDSRLFHARTAVFHRQPRNFWLLVMAVSLIFILAACGGGDTPAAEPAAEPTVETAPTNAPAAEEAVADELAVTEEPAADPTAEPVPTVAPEPPVRSVAAGEYVYSNGNKVRDVAVYGDVIWAASTGGLVRYDLATGEGRKYTTQDGLPNIGVYALEVCPVNGEDRLIVGNRNGLVVYDAANDGWEAGETIGFPADDAIHEMRCDAVNGRLILEHDDVSILDLATQTMTHVTEEDGLAWFAVEQLIVLGDDIWAPTDFKGISRIGLDGAVETWTEEGGFPDDNVSDIALDGNGVSWLGLSDGLLRWENGEYTLLTRDTHPDVIDYFGPDHVETAADGTLWLGFNSSVCNFDPASESCVQQFDLQDDLGFADYANVARLEALADGRLWLHTYDEGLAMFDGGAWTIYALENQTPTNMFSGLIQTSDGAVWAYGDGLYRTDLAVSAWQPFPEFSAADMVEAPDGALWMVAGRRVARFDGQQLRIFETEDGLLEVTYNAIDVDDQGVVYAVGSPGYSIIDGETITSVGEADGWDFGNIRDVLVADGSVYAATVSGLAQIEGDSWTVLLDETFVNLPDENIGALAPLADGTLLLGTTRGLAMYRDGVVTAVPEVTGSIYDIFVTADDQIHVVSLSSGGQDGGYFHFDGSSWQMRADTEFPMTSLRAVLVDSEQTVWIGMGDTGLGGGIFRIVP